MSLSFGIMIEAQEGLTWDRWRRLAGTVEDAGYDALFRSDGSADSVVKDLRRWEELGISRFMLQLLDMEDLEAIRFMGRHVLPALRR